MINKKVLRASAEYRQTFVAAKPFKHVCIENFFAPDLAELALSDFPSFDPKKAVNEFGDVGRKAVNMEIAEISDFYRRLDNYIKSDDFLRSISDLTGVPDLLPDPNLYGGGTHENLHGQELDPHIDFNYDSKTGYHRRLNLLLYLNKEWSEEWGGSIEIHSNPRDPEANQIRSFLPLFNRAVIFETNEFSWHGFPRINLPENMRSLSRKCLSIYLYSKERPADEVAPPHGTFYVQRPLPARFCSGYTLQDTDIGELNQLFTKRDKWIEGYQRNELQNSAQIEQYRAKVILPLQGYIKGAGPATDYFFDNWVGPEFSAVLIPLQPVTKIAISGFIPQSFPDLSLQATIDGIEVAQLSPGKDSFQWELHMAYELRSEFRLSISANASYCAAEQGEGADVRRLVFLLQGLAAIHA